MCTRRPASKPPLDPPSLPQTSERASNTTSERPVTSCVQHRGLIAHPSRNLAIPQTSPSLSVTKIISHSQSYSITKWSPRQLRAQTCLDPFPCTQPEQRQAVPLVVSDDPASDSLCSKRFGGDQLVVLADPGELAERVLPRHPVEDAGAKVHDVEHVLQASNAVWRGNVDRRAAYRLGTVEHSGVDSGRTANTSHEAEPSIFKGVVTLKGVIMKAGANTTQGSTGAHDEKQALQG